MWHWHSGEEKLDQGGRSCSYVLPPFVQRRLLWGSFHQKCLFSPWLIQLGPRRNSYDTWLSRDQITITSKDNNNRYLQVINEQLCAGSYLLHMLRISLHIPLILQQMNPFCSQFIRPVTTLFKRGMEWVINTYLAVASLFRWLGELRRHCLV